ncbi:hypothetical protein SAMN06264346_10193 [Chryseobacterium profundimaris]|uniref:Transposase n=1 Tax=Chryseobacterium profundimaris TaxID=1387275 RepID=A0ABY1N780_9FLAO|nr:hypothetical protein SAMN06264346_10193 [Chryseobacterium profundimaris]
MVTLKKHDAILQTNSIDSINFVIKKVQKGRSNKGQDEVLSTNKIQMKLI